MSVAPFYYKGWYDQRLSTHDPELVSRTRVDSFKGTSAQECKVSYLVYNLTFQTKKTLWQFMDNHDFFEILKA